jgi:predicted RNA-binding Zn-ribbon protein involved in translation (DUF1610 family)
MERFFTQKNVERYRRMLVNPRDEAQRRIILTLLADEAAKLKEQAPRAGKARPAGMFVSNSTTAERMPSVTAFAACPTCGEAMQVSPRATPHSTQMECKQCGHLQSRLVYLDPPTSGGPGPNAA